jgi:formylglycine-generating enzyme required for sulfatase activity
MSLGRSGAALLAALAWASPASAAEPTVAVDLGSGIRLDLVLVKAGTFRQGSPSTEAGRGDDETAREVTISRDFYIGKYPVTRAQFARFVAETGYRTEAEKGTSGGFGFDGQGLVQRKEFTWRSPGFAQDDDHPVVLVTYDDALAFSQWLSRKARRMVTLPTEAQWERACRAGSNARFYQGASDDEARTIAWFKANAGNGTRAVGQKKPNAFGLYDVSGNVYQWALDWYGPYGPGPVTDPLESRSTLSDKPRRVLRGGSWLKDARSVRCAARYRNTPGSRNADNGFRVVAAAEEPAALAATATVPSPAPEGAGTYEGPWLWWVLGMLGLLAIPLVPLALLVWIGLKVFRRGPRGVRTHIGDDGFWIYSPDHTRGRAISYRAVVDGVDRFGTIASPGSQGEYVYTGGKVARVRILDMAAATALGQAMATRDEEAPRRQWDLDRQREDDERRRSRSDSSFTGYPSAY